MNFNAIHQITIGWLTINSYVYDHCALCIICIFLLMVKNATYARLLGGKWLTLHSSIKLQRITSIKLWHTILVVDKIKSKKFSLEKLWSKHRKITSFWLISINSFTYIRVHQKRKWLEHTTMWKKLYNAKNLIKVLQIL
jgi:hypothetical protein